MKEKDSKQQAIADLVLYGIVLPIGLVLYMGLIGGILR